MRERVEYTEEFKEMALQKLLTPGSLGLKKVANELGVPSSTLFGWKEKCTSIGFMKKHKSKVKSKNTWSPEEKLEAILNQKVMSENEFGEYLRANGLHSVDVDNFKIEYLELLRTKKENKQNSEILDLRREKKELERDISRKDKALAEMSARIVLLKKSHLLWGAPEEDE